MNRKNEEQGGVSAKGLILWAAVLALGIVTAWHIGGIKRLIRYRADSFGSSYITLLHEPGSRELEVGKEICQEARDCMTYMGDEGDAPAAEGLSGFYYFNSGTVRPSDVYCDIDLQTVSLHGSSGVVWFEYSLERYDAAGDSLSGSWHILVRCDLEKDGSGSYVVKNTVEDI
ncbi:MAG: hypothetical protein IJ806_09400 [Ruminococcus sp.]|nr:hypothetical protein [Ruminococcus sp.]